MTDQERQRLADVLNLFPEVKWDRFVPFEQEGRLTFVAAYGWLPARPDGRCDFLLVEQTPDGTWFTTSSAKHSEEFGARLNEWSKIVNPSPHQPCQRIADHLGDLVGHCVPSVRDLEKELRERRDVNFKGEAYGD